MRMVKKFALYDYDMSEMLSATYDSEAEALDDADRLNNVVVVCIGEFPACDGDDEDEDEEEKEHGVPEATGDSPGVD